MKWVSSLLILGMDDENDIVEECDVDEEGLCMEFFVTFML